MSGIQPLHPLPWPRSAPGRGGEAGKGLPLASGFQRGASQGAHSCVRTWGAQCPHRKLSFIGTPWSISVPLDGAPPRVPPPHFRLEPRPQPLRPQPRPQAELAGPRPLPSCGRERCSRCGRTRDRGTRGGGAQAPISEPRGECTRDPLPPEALSAGLCSPPGPHSGLPTLAPQRPPPCAPPGAWTSPAPGAAQAQHGLTLRPAPAGHSYFVKLLTVILRRVPSPAWPPARPPPPPLGGGARLGAALLPALGSSDGGLLHPSAGTWTLEEVAGPCGGALCSQPPPKTHGKFPTLHLSLRPSDLWMPEECCLLASVISWGISAHLLGSLPVPKPHAPVPLIPAHQTHPLSRPRASLPKPPSQNLG